MITGNTYDEQENSTPLVMPAISNSGGTYTYPFDMPPGRVAFDIEYGVIEAVAKVAYVSGQGQKNGGYDYKKDATTGAQIGTADSWGTASDDLQAVINSWTGPTTSPRGNFDEIWIEGTVTPKTRANNTTFNYIIGTGDITGAADPDLAFVIPPGLKIYGGFKGTERYVQNSTAIGDFPGPISTGINSDPNPYDKRDKTGEDWRLRTVLSGALTGTTNAYHVVIIVDDDGDDDGNGPDTDEDGKTLLDGLTISDGMGADSADAITVKTYQIDKRSGAGLYLVNASPVLTNVRVQNNTATANSLDVGEEDSEGSTDEGTIIIGGGGGIYNLAADGGTSSPRLTNTVISRNRVMGNGAGAGMYNDARGDGSVCHPVLFNVKIQQNQTSGNGGGLSNSAVRATATQNTICEPEIKGNSEITRNVAANGAGVYNYNYSAPTFTNVEIRENIAHLGGGLMSYYYTRPVITNVTISGNSAANGGGVDNRSHYLTMTNVTISGNSGSGYGGGLYNYRGGAVLTNVLIENNTGGSGGGIYHRLDSTSHRTVLVITNGIIRDNKSLASGGGIRNDYGFTGSGNNNMDLRLALTNVLITNNTANGNGGGMYCSNSVASATLGKGINVLMNNVTITKNTATTTAAAGQGGGIYLTTNNKVTVTVNNSIVWGNTSDISGSSNIYKNANSSLTLDYSLAQDGYTYTVGSTNKNPANFSGTYGPFAGATDYTLPNGSTLINAGSNALYPANADDLIGGALTGTGTRETDFKTLIEGGTVNGEPIKGAVFFDNDNDGEDDGPATKDATAAVGNAAPAGNSRFNNGTIDVGAFEK
jgi:hypothetical protein